MKVDYSYDSITYEYNVKAFKDKNSLYREGGVRNGRIHGIVNNKQKVLISKQSGKNYKKVPKFLHFLRFFHLFYAPKALTRLHSGDIMEKNLIYNIYIINKFLAKRKLQE